MPKTDLCRKGKAGIFFFMLLTDRCNIVRFILPRLFSQKPAGKWVWNLLKSSDIRRKFISR